MILRLLIFMFLFAPAAALACPANFVMVPADGEYITENWCLSAYEMKKGKNGPVSSWKGSPWNKNHIAAKNECDKLGFQLPTNDLWQAMARNAEKIGENWTGGTTGRGALKGTVTIQTLEGYRKIYNAGDSVWEQIEDRLSEDPGVSGKIEQINPVEHTKLLTVGKSKPRDPKGQFGPEYPTYNDTSNIASLGFITAYGGPEIMRGGDDDNPGLFGLAMNHGEEEAGEDVGFRCACQWDECHTH